MTLRIGSIRFGNRRPTSSPAGRRRHLPALERLDDRVLPSLAYPFQGRADVL
jgi:hypothetical protein